MNGSNKTTTGNGTTKLTVDMPTGVRKAMQKEWRSDDVSIKRTINSSEGTSREISDFNSQSSTPSSLSKDGTVVPGPLLRHGSAGRQEQANRERTGFITHFVREISLCLWPTRRNSSRFLTFARLQQDNHRDRDNLLRRRHAHGCPQDNAKRMTVRRRFYQEISKFQ